jgi:hypothetical protein
VQDHKVIFWEYDPIADTWTQKADVGGGNRSDGVGFSINGKGYVCSGDVNSVAKKDLWEYDPLTDTWTQKASLPGLGRTDAIGLSDGTIGYVGIGFSPALDGLTDFYEYTPDGTLLPIGLASFSAVEMNGQIEIDWSTATELNNEFFTVEKSQDGQHFETLIVVNGAGTSLTTRNYNAIDLHPSEGYNYYRLKQTDFDGSTSYSEVVVVQFSFQKINQGNSIHVYPNPVNDILSLTMNFTLPENIEVRIFNTSGAMVIDRYFAIEKGPQQIDFDISTFDDQLYLLSVIAASAVYSEKFIK